MANPEIDRAIQILILVICCRTIVPIPWAIATLVQNYGPEGKNKCYNTSCLIRFIYLGRIEVTSLAAKRR